MLFSRDWLADYVDLPEDTGELAERLTAVGLAVEGIEEVNGDLLLDCDVTANRPDCMAHLGLAREAAVALNTSLRVPETLQAGGKSTEELPVPIEIDPGAATACLRYVGLVIEGVTVGPSTDWLARRLRAIGLRPINNVVDVTNYVLWETSKPIHAFDLDRLRGPRVEVRFARPGETLVTLDGTSRELGAENLVIADAERPVGLGGVIGGRDSEVTTSTSRVLIESAHFDPTAVRRSAGRFELHTDASHRFERGADFAACRSAAERAAALIAELAGGTVRPGVIDVRSGAELPTLAGRLDLARLSAFAGIEVTREEAERILSGLGFGVRTIDDGGVLEVEVPSWRHYDFNVTAPSGEVWFADLAEEVIRHLRLDRIPARLPAVIGPDAESAEGHRRRRGLREHLAASGFLETVSYAFGSAEAARAFPSPIPGEPVELANPLSERLSTLRCSLLPGLVEAALYNLRRGAGGVRLFESGHLFVGDGQGGVVERESLAWIAGGSPAGPWDGAPAADLFAVKGVAEDLVERLGRRLEARPVERQGFAPGTAAALHLAASEETLGYVGRLEGAESPVALFVAELLVDGLPVSPPLATVTASSRFPGIEADLTLTHPEELSWSEIAAAVDELASADLRRFRLKGRYRGAGVPEGAVNTTITFLYQRLDRSLVQEKVNELYGRLAGELRRRFDLAG
ncbi:MAG: phenylalanine--tRNA ligase subunit beta [Thermoanaerobaculia bacterium]